MIFAIITVGAICLVTIPKLRIRIVYENELLVLDIGILHLEFKIKTKDKDGSTKPPISAIISRATEMLRHSTMEVRRLSVPSALPHSTAPGRYFLPYGYHIAVFALMAFLETRTKELILQDGAISVDGEQNASFALDVTVTVRLFYIIKPVVGLIRDIKFKGKKKEKTYVGN